MKQDNLLTLKVLSALLSYPQAEMLEALPDMMAVVERENYVPHNTQTALCAWMHTLHATDLLTLQEAYVALFDRGRALSLHLFEHIHGESRDRGQAMVDLLRLYQNHGYELTARELPDYIPLFLEFLAQHPANFALLMLQDAIPVLSLLGARLAERQSPYALIFDALRSLSLTGDIENTAIRAKVAAEGPDATLINMDAIWEEEAVSFMGNTGGCGQQPPATNSVTQPINLNPRILKAQTRTPAI